MTKATDDELFDEFLGTPEGEALDAFREAGLKALNGGAATVEMPTALFELLLPELTAPTDSFVEMANVWNRICTERGRPDLLKVVPAEDPASESEDGPF